MLISTLVWVGFISDGQQIIIVGGVITHQEEFKSARIFALDSSSPLEMHWSLQERAIALILSTKNSRLISDTDTSLSARVADSKIKSDNWTDFSNAFLSHWIGLIFSCIAVCGGVKKKTKWDNSIWRLARGNWTGIKRF